MTETQLQQTLEDHLEQLKRCTACPNMIGPVITPSPVVSKVYLCGQAPGPREGSFGRPFAWTAGKTLFKWFETIGINEEQFRSLAYIGAVCRCFPGKTKQGGDRVPSAQEVSTCSSWMNREFRLMQPQLVIPVGRLAIEQFLPIAPLNDIIGRKFEVEAFDQKCDVIPLPHPSGASTWFKREPGITLLSQALVMLGNHPAWQQLVESTET
jgi:uracil-DNA glycosylase